MEEARARQETRAARSGVRINAELAGRAIHRVLRVSRTIADLEGAADVTLPHLAEAVRYRVLPDGSVFGDGP